MECAHTLGRYNMGNMLFRLFSDLEAVVLKSKVSLK